MLLKSHTQGVIFGKLSEAIPALPVKHSQPIDAGVEAIMFVHTLRPSISGFIKEDDRAM